jgi:hypothetical protein
MKDEMRQLLTDIYENDIFALQKRIGKDLTRWIRKPEKLLQLPIELQNEQKLRQAEFFDHAKNPDFEIERPKGTAGFINGRSRRNSTLLLDC